MRGRKQDGKREKLKITQRGKEIEDVQEFNQQNNGNEVHIKNPKKKAMTALGKIWWNSGKKF